jgi:hypothetical protein
MPIHWREGLKGRWPVVVYSDPYTTDELDRALTEILAHPVGAPPLRLLVDRRYCTAPTTAFVQHIADFIEGHLAQYTDGRIAIVTSDDTGFGVGRMTQTIAELRQLPCRFQVFRDWSDAEKWLTKSSTN